MSHTPNFRASLWLAIPLLAVAGQLAMAANHAPVLNASKSPVLEPEFQNWGPPAGAMGTLISALVDFAVPAGQVDNVTDVDAGAKLGIAVTAANASNGTWWYSINNGTNWYALGAVTNKSARLLAADATARIYFTPNANYTGTISNAITFRAWDQTSGTNGGLANTTKTGGSTAFSTATDTASLTVEQLPPVEYHVTFIGPLANSDGTELWAIDNHGGAVGRSRFPDGYHAIRLTPLGELEDISSLAAPWLDLETDPPTPVNGWIFTGALDFNEAGRIVGNAWNGIFTRAVVYDDLSGYVLLPRLQDSPYGEAKYRIDSINENGEAQGWIQPVGSGYLNKTFLWTPTNPSAISLIESVASSMPKGVGTNMFMTQQQGTLGVLNLYAFAFVDGAPVCELLDTINDSFGGAWAASTCINDNGEFGYVTDGATTQSVKLYRPGQSTLTVHESTSYNHYTGFRMNNSGDFIYVVDDIPYLYRCGENRSYRLYDLADSVTKDVLFADRSGKINSAIGLNLAIVSDDNAAGVPAGNPYDSLGGTVRDISSQADMAFILSPVSK